MTKHADDKLVHWLVVTPTLGRSSTLNTAAVSVARLPGLVSHVIVCPDDVVHSVRSKAPSALVVPEVNGSGGMYSAINQAVLAAAAYRLEWQFLVCLNDDDYLVVEQCEKLLRTLSNIKNSIIYGRTIIIDGGGRRLFRSPHARFGSHIACLLSQGIVPFMHVSMIVPRNVWDKHGPYSENYKLAGDLEYIVRCAERGVRFHSLGHVFGAFRVHSGQLSRQRSEVGEEASRILGASILHCNALFRKAVVLWFRMENIPSYIARFFKIKAVRSHDLFN